MPIPPRTNQTLKTGPGGLRIIKHWEQCRLEAYLPTPNDVPTIGWGHTGHDVHLGQRITQDEADHLLVLDVGKFEVWVRKGIHDAPTSQNEFDAMVSLCFNIGPGAFDQDGNVLKPGFLTSSVLKYHVQGMHKEAKAAFLLWNKQKGKVLDGLTNRRREEAELYDTP